MLPKCCPAYQVGSLRAALYSVFWRREARKRRKDIKLPPYPTHNHTREDSALYPCALCKAQQRKIDRLYAPITKALDQADAWEAVV